MTQPTLIGIDIGTSSIKVVAVDFNGEVMIMVPVGKMKDEWCN